MTTKLRFGKVPVPSDDKSPTTNLPQIFQGDSRDSAQAFLCAAHWSADEQKGYGSGKKQRLPIGPTR
jgi:hypothetical protein